MVGARDIHFCPGLIFKHKGIVCKVRYLNGRHMALDRWEFSRRTNAWEYSEAKAASWIIEPFNGYAAKGEIEVLKEVPKEVL
jgi:hypothetical protein